MKLLIDCRELARDELRSHGLILREVVPKLSSKVDVALCMDINAENEDINRLIKRLDCPVYVWGRRATTGISVLRYHYWMRQLIKQTKPKFFWQINHFLLFGNGKTNSVSTIHDLFPISGFSDCSISRKLLFWCWIMLTLINSKRIMVPSRQTAMEIRKKFPLIRKPIDVVPNGLPERHAEMNRPLLLEKEQKYILYLGRLNYWKGTDLLLSLVEQFDLPEGAIMVFAGQADFAMKERLKCVQARLGKKLLVLDYVSDSEKEYLLTHADLFLYPSRYDGFGIPPLEAASRSVPVLISDIPILKEVTHGCGNTFQLSDGADGLNDAITRLCGRFGSELSADVAAMKVVADSYSWDVYVEELIKSVSQC